MNEWRPIETAPNDRDILVAYKRMDERSVDFIEAADNDYDWQPYVEHSDGLRRPTHWMPPPAPPDSGDEKHG